MLLFLLFLDILIPSCDILSYLDLGLSVGHCYVSKYRTRQFFEKLVNFTPKMKSPSVIPMSECRTLVCVQDFKYPTRQFYAQNEVFKCHTDV